jgi:hypothetical protein
LDLKDIRQRIIISEGNPETSDARTNIPFILLALLYGQNDLEKTILAALSCGYDTDTTGASAGALIGQILGASHIPAALKDKIGDELVMGIDYRRDEMTISALARDTAILGVRLAKESRSGVQFTDLPAGFTHPAFAQPEPTRLSVEYFGLPCAAPGESCSVIVHVEGKVPPDSTIHIQAPSGWLVVPQEATVDPVEPYGRFTLFAPRKDGRWSIGNRFIASLGGSAVSEPLEYPFGIAGAGLWQFLGVYFDTLPAKGAKVHPDKIFRQHFVSLDRLYIPEPEVAVANLYRDWSQKLGKDALIPSYEMEIDLGRLVGLEGSYCAYLARTIYCPEDRLANIVIGNTDSYRLYLNGELAAEVDECVAWSPFNNVHAVELKEGTNQILLKLLRRTDSMRFTLGFRERKPNDNGQNTQDLMIDLEDIVPSRNATASNL